MMPEEFLLQIIGPMREELVRLGFQELRTPEEVEKTFEQEGTTLVAINSMCGCAGGIARPAAAMAMEHPVKPDRFVTVFAGQDRDATERAREYFTGEPPSSPSFALLKDGKLVHMIHRERIETRDAHQVATDLKAAFDEHCN